MKISVCLSTSVAALALAAHSGHYNHHFDKRAKTFLLDGKLSGMRKQTKVKAAAAAVVPVTVAAPAPSSSSNDGNDDDDDDDDSSSSSTVSGVLSGVKAFLGPQTGAIGSWFRTNAATDSTNGESWCWLKYQDNWMGGAINVQTMIDAAGSREAAQRMFCGLEVVGTNPANGNKATFYIVDGFDPKWVLTPTSVDLTLAAYTALYGSFDGDKNKVVKGMTWEFTGNRKAEYAFRG